MLHWVLVELGMTRRAQLNYIAADVGPSRSGPTVE